MCVDMPGAPAKRPASAAPAAAFLNFTSSFLVWQDRDDAMRNADGQLKLLLLSNI